MMRYLIEQIRLTIAMRLLEAAMLVAPVKDSEGVIIIKGVGDICLRCAAQIKATPSRRYVA